VLFEVGAGKVDILFIECLFGDGDMFVDGILGLGGFPTTVYLLGFFVLAVGGD
jgi:hypothetical protein